MNGGTCKDLGDEKYECQCTDAYIGDHCELGLYFRECILVQSAIKPYSRIICRYCIWYKSNIVLIFFTDTLLQLLMFIFTFFFFHLFGCGHTRFIIWLDSITRHCFGNKMRPRSPFRRAEGGCWGEGGGGGGAYSESSRRCLCFRQLIIL